MAPVVLVLRALGLGDLLTAVPAIRGVRRALPDAQLVLATASWLAPVIDLVEAVDSHLPAGELEPLAWTGRPPDVAVNMHGCGPESHRILVDLKPRRTVGFERADAGLAGPRWQPDEHEVSRWCRLVNAELGGPARDDDLILPAPAMRTGRAIRAGYVVMHPGATTAARRWPAVRFAEVARWLAAQGTPVVVTGSAAERSLADRVCRLAGLPPDANLAGRTDLGRLMRLVSAARLVVSNDTGVAHLATAFTVPSVVLFGPVDPRLWGPRSGPHRVIWPGASVDPHDDQVDPLLAGVDPEEVITAAAGLLGADGPV